MTASAEASPSIESESPVQPGDTVAEKFHVDSFIGIGGMGVVLRATHTGLDEQVALKFLRRGSAQRPDVVQRFALEARAAVKLKSEFVARVMDVGTHQGMPFMVMELLEGQDLGDFIRENGALPMLEACEFLVQACEGLGEAHARGIVHRDVKPENLFIVDRAGERSVKVLDFGISKVALTSRIAGADIRGESDGLMGSPYYMSPEQLRAVNDVDRCSDIWSLGALLFEMLTGETAFSDTDEFSVLMAEILERPHRKLSVLRPDLPAGLEVIIDRCMAKDRADRYQSTAELAIALSPFVRSRARSVAARAVSIAKAAGFASGLAVPASMPPPPSSPDLSFAPGPKSGIVRSIDPGTPVNDSRSPTAPEGSLAITAREEPSKARWWMLAPVAILLLGGGLAWGAFSGRGGSVKTGLQEPGTGTPAAPAAIASPSADQQVAAQGPAVTAPATHDAPSASSVRGSHAGAAPWPPKKGGAPAPTASASAAPTPPPPTPGLDIRRER